MRRTRQDEVEQKVTDLKFTTSFSLGFSEPPPHIPHRTHEQDVLEKLFSGSFDWLLKLPSTSADDLV